MRPHRTFGTPPPVDLQRSGLGHRVTECGAETIGLHGHQRVVVVQASNQSILVFLVDGPGQRIQISNFGGVEFTELADDRLCRRGNGDPSKFVVPRRYHAAVLVDANFHPVDVTGVSQIADFVGRVRAPEGSHGFYELRERASTSTGGPDGLGSATLDAAGAPGASVPPQPATLVTTTIPTTDIRILQKARRIDWPPVEVIRGAYPQTKGRRHLIIT